MPNLPTLPKAKHFPMQSTLKDESFQNCPGVEASFQRSLWARLFWRTGRAVASIVTGQEKPRFPNPKYKDLDSKIAFDRVCDHRFLGRSRPGALASRDPPPHTHTHSFEMLSSKKNNILSLPRQLKRKTFKLNAKPFLFQVPPGAHSEAFWSESECQSRREVIFRSNHPELR